MKKNKRIGETFSGKVTKIKDDRVFFIIERFRLQDNETVLIEENAAFFIHAGFFNPHKFFKTGEIVELKITRQYNPKKNPYSLHYEVLPLILPSDEYIKEHPIGSTVKGTIESITGATMVVYLAPNVYAVTKRIKHAKTGLKIDCKIDRFHNQKISLRVF